ncbi:alkaline phosphatase family protein [Gloeobacter kilaueensis]|uniref:Type I phosphodiesterase/nucleotide pyrophosphatase n=1 Tax=Gloeobacter kilaueensis (strain ATCC BAA-2537 / CCAP 1431/1 / ULC 316 / JS1) TaxID=1183438 RepID=U5QFA3_GLOK1|nr:alkaline phosphatase family protein [Gloeobacter kilaueensis]AGY57621.1 type I phosphodiesterase/nucleotide pyrophosphatase [Gloeobacter kilaueensis JS1]
MREAMNVQKFACTFSLVALLAASPAQAATNAAGRHFQRVLLLSIDGLHAIDLANYVQNNPQSALAGLSAAGVTFSAASASRPSDSFPGLLAMVTGGSPVSTGVFYDDSYDRKLSAPTDTACASSGTEVLYDETVDINSNLLGGGGGINTAALPRDPAHGCSPVFPHSYLRVNTVFEVIKAAGLRTAWSDKHLAYDLVNGPSGQGVDDLYTPEIAATTFDDGVTPICTPPLPASITKSVACTEIYDDLKVQALLNQIAGKNAAGTQRAAVPALFGMNFQAVSVGQKLPTSPTLSGQSEQGGYLDGQGTPGPALADALAHTDQSVGKMVSALKKRGLLASTLIIVSAKHGQTPIDPTKLQTFNTGIADPAGLLGSTVAQATEDDISLLWLTSSSQTPQAVSTLSANQTQAGIEQILAGQLLQLQFNDPTTDSRTPDIVVQPTLGVIYTGSTSKIAEHGGFGANDTGVALLVSNPRLSAATIKTPVQTAQIAPTILRALGLDPNALKAVQIEKTRTLPGLIAP